MVDRNGLQGFGTTREVAGLEPLKEKLSAFGVKVREVEGHDPKALEEALSWDEPGPRVLLLNTTKGKGVSFMENKVEWHYLPMTKGQYDQALAEIERT